MNPVYLLSFLKIFPILSFLFHFYCLRASGIPALFEVKWLKYIKQKQERPISLSVDLLASFLVVTFVTPLWFENVS